MELQVIFFQGIYLTESTFLNCTESKVQMFWEDQIHLKKISQFYLSYHLVNSKNFGDFFMILWPSQNIWTLTNTLSTWSNFQKFEYLMIFAQCVLREFGKASFLCLSLFSTSSKFANCPRQTKEHFLRAKFNNGRKCWLLVGFYSLLLNLVWPHF